MQSDTPIPMAVILQSISEQLGAYCAQTTTLEDVVSPYLSQDNGLPNAVIREMQGLDRIRQGLGDIATLTQMLSQAAHADAVDADQAAAMINELRLSSTKSLLAPSAGPQTSTPAASQEPDLHLF